jgi:hypothetical protein
LNAAQSLATCVSVTSSPPVAYLDSSALVKLIAIEAETAALRQELRPWPDRASSLLATVEVTRTARRLGGQAPAVAVGVLAGLRLLAIEPIVKPQPTSRPRHARESCQYRWAIHYRLNR